MRLLIALAVLAGGMTVSVGGCTSTGIAVREYFGYAKREQLVDRVKAVRDSQGAAKKQFESALAQFLAVTDAKSDPGVAELEARYTKLKREYDRSDERARAVRDRIAGVQAVGEALFKEWRAELAEYSKAEIRQTSEKQLEITQGQFDKMVAAMKAAESRMDPVLAAFKDQVLFLKHNLNARAVASLQGTAAQVQSDVSQLVAEMERAIAEANAFIDSIGANKG